MGAAQMNLSSARAALESPSEGCNAICCGVLLYNVLVTLSNHCTLVNRARIWQTEIVGCGRREVDHGHARFGLDGEDRVSPARRGGWSGLPVAQHVKVLT